MKKHLPVPPFPVVQGDAFLFRYAYLFLYLLFVLGLHLVRLEPIRRRVLCA